MTDSQGESAARDLLVGRRITAVCFYEGFIEIHFDDVILTGYTPPFGIINCGGVGPGSLPNLVGKEVDNFEVVPGRYLAIDSVESRLAFPLDEDSRTGPEAVQLFKPAHYELDLPAEQWVW